MFLNKLTNHFYYLEFSIENQLFIIINFKLSAHTLMKNLFKMYISISSNKVLNYNEFFVLKYFNKGC